jgi:hypothetical protein
MPLNGNAFLALWNDIAPAREADYERWHTLEHVPERVAVTGFRGARRYVNRRRPDHRYFTLYEVDSLATFDHAEYLDLLQNPTPWSASMRPDFSNLLRAPSTVVASASAGIGGALAILCFEVPPVDVLGIPTRALLEMPGVTGVHLGSGKPDTGAASWRPDAGPPAPQRPFDRLLLIEALERDAAAGALAAARRALGLQTLPTDFGCDVYDLMFVFPGGNPTERLRHRRATWPVR